MNLEKPDKQKALRFSRELLSLYFEKRDMDTLAHHMEERTSWIGTGEGELCGNLAEVGAALSAERGDYFVKQTARADNQSLHPDFYVVLKPQDIRLMLQCAMLDEGAFVGYVGFDECRENRTRNERQIASFKLTADVLSTFLMKLREKQKRMGGMK